MCDGCDACLLNALVRVFERVQQRLDRFGVVALHKLPQRLDRRPSKVASLGVEAVGQCPDRDIVPLRADQRQPVNAGAADALVRVFQPQHQRAHSGGIAAFGERLNSHDSLATNEDLLVAQAQHHRLQQLRISNRADFLEGGDRGEADVAHRTDQQRRHRRDSARVPAYRGVRHHPARCLAHAGRAIAETVHTRHHRFVVALFADGLDRFERHGRDQRVFVRGALEHRGFDVRRQRDPLSLVCFDVVPEDVERIFLHLDGVIEEARRDALDDLGVALLQNHRQRVHRLFPRPRERRGDHGEHSLANNLLDLVRRTPLHHPGHRLGDVVAHR
mmetsp:Transcript_40240/g.94669  ORF Transcript_40240/g.94669 Transcript_40240/m.94669 type:complete len:331 (-) Transcript_40240:1208-2200(-)